LLLDDAFKPATPLTNGVINETLQHFAPLNNISQGSVATVVRSLVMILLQYNKFENRLKFDKVISHTKIVPFLGPHVLIC